MKQKIILVFSLFTASLLLTACGKQTTTTITPTPTPKLIDMPLSERPYISLIPRDDGHMLYLKISNIPTYIAQIEYEVLYNAVDNGSEIEKGIGDTIKEITSNLERKLLLGTESCTNGCKYKFDSGIIGGTVTLNFIDKNGQMSTFETPFTLKSSADFKKDGELKLLTENFSVKPKAKITGSDYYILIKNYRGGYSVFSNGNNPTVGDYPQP